MLLIEKPNFSLASDRRLVKSSEFATVSSAADIIAAAEKEAARIREEAKAAFEEEKKRGYEKGLRDGKIEISMQKMDQVDQSVAFMESVESKMAGIVMKALKSCVVEIGDKEMVVNIVRKTMNAVIRTQRHVTLPEAQGAGLHPRDRGRRGRCIRGDAARGDRAVDGPSSVRQERANR